MIDEEKKDAGIISAVYVEYAALAHGCSSYRVLQQVSRFGEDVGFPGGRFGLRAVRRGRLGQRRRVRPGEAGGV